MALKLLRAVLTPRLRDAFLARAVLGDFSFRVRSADASVAWTASFPESLICANACAATVELLVAFREALGRLTLVRRT